MNNSRNLLSLAVVAIVAAILVLSQTVEVPVWLASL
jgi:hypothetical protein